MTGTAEKMCDQCSGKKLVLNYVLETPTKIRAEIMGWITLITGGRWEGLQKKKKKKRFLLTNNCLPSGARSDFLDFSPVERGLGVVLLQPYATMSYNFKFTKMLYCKIQLTQEWKT